MTDASKPAATPEGADPSMEDILASIRRILNEEEAPAPPVEEPPAAPEEDDVLVLDQSMMVSRAEVEGEPVAHAPAASPEPERVAAEPVHQEKDVAVQPEPVAVHALPALTPELVAPETAAAAASSVGSLMRTLAAGRATQVYAGGPTLEDIVRSELRPLLKDWLDTNLPPM